MVLENSTPKRKYRALKRREKWSAEEHRRFLEALEIYGRDWMKITQHVVSKSRVQVRSHAQKYFLKLEKSQKQNNTLPPPGSPTTPMLEQREGEQPEHIRLSDADPELARPSDVVLDMNSSNGAADELYGNAYSVLSSLLDPHDLKHFDQTAVSCADSTDQNAGCRSHTSTLDLVASGAEPDEDALVETQILAGLPESELIDHMNDDDFVDDFLNISSVSGSNKYKGAYMSFDDGFADEILMASSSPLAFEGFN